MRKVLSIALIALTALSAACVKSGQLTTQSTGGIMFVNASVNQPDIDVYSYATEIFPNLTFPDSTGYTQVGIGTTFNLTYVIAGNPEDTLVYGYATLPTATDYSFFFIDSLAGKTQVVTLQDQMTTPPQDSAAIRFVNLSLTAPFVNFVNSQTSRSLFSGVGFASNLSTAQNFTSISAGTYNFGVTTGSTPLAQMTGFNLAAGGLYTFFLAGSIDSTGKKALSIQVIRNK